MNALDAVHRHSACMHTAVESMKKHNSTLVTAGPSGPVVVIFTDAQYVLGAGSVGWGRGGWAGLKGR